MLNAEIEVKMVPGSEPLFAFYRDQIEPYLRARTGRRLLLGKSSQALAMFEAVKTRLPEDAHPVVEPPGRSLPPTPAIRSAGAVAFLASLVARRSRRAVSGIDIAHVRPCDSRYEVHLAPDRSNPKIDRSKPGAFLELWLECVMMKETGKGRKSRIELGYYRKPDRLLRLRRLLWVLAIIATAGLLLAAGIADRPANSHSWSIVPRRIASKGPVAEPHAMWDANCDACHTGFAPVNSTRWAPSFWNGSTAGSTKCKNCHAGPVHHQSERKEDVPACAECHRDHRGRDASLLDVDDSSCTACHQNLPGHRDQAAGSIIVAAQGTQGRGSQPI